jgi:flavin-dependent dehydrogenase
MAGDAAGMITPVCGNGMAVAIRSAKMLSDLLVRYNNGAIDRGTLESAYEKMWNDTFRSRLWFGRNVQRLFGHPLFSAVAVALARSSASVANFIVSRTHGKPF